jgi:serine-type D-Ala-D-Ala carboxypeptidase (penicillin-binding protein 5/6)
VPSARRKRYRYRLRRLAPVGLLVVFAGLGGAWIGSHRPTNAIGSNVALAGVAHRPVADKKPSDKKSAAMDRRRHVVAPEPLLAGGSLLRHRFAPQLAGAAAVLVDAKTGRVLWARRAHQRRHIASTTKIMTALLALRQLQPNDVVTVDKSVPRVPLVREGLRAGERVKAWKLFLAMLLYSGNDDALALAIAAGGDKWTFIRAMNAEADKLGLRDTHFSSPSGVKDADNYSSAWDLAALTRVAMRNDRFRKIVRTKIAHVKWSAPTYAKIYVNNNRLLRTYRGADGVKTGYTHKAGPCLVASATRGGVSLIAVVLNSSNMYGDASRLLDFGFTALG